MKFYIAELIATSIAFLCALTNHAGACWVWRKLMPLDEWATNLMDSRGVNQSHRFAAPEGVKVPSLTATQVVCNCFNPRIRFTGGEGAAAMSYHYCPAHGTVRES
jgi:hypothetical protein